LVVTGARCPLTKPVVTAVELQATTEPHCSRGVQPGGICVYVGTARADSRRSGVGLAPRPQALPMPAAALILYIFLLRRNRQGLTPYVNNGPARLLLQVRGRPSACLLVAPLIYTGLYRAAGRLPGRWGPARAKVVPAPLLPRCRRIANTLKIYQTK
jgi:hypothetical protein